MNVKHNNPSLISMNIMNLISGSSIWIENFIRIVDVNSTPYDMLLLDAKISPIPLFIMSIKNPSWTIKNLSTK